MGAAKPGDVQVEFVDRRSTVGPESQDHGTYLGLFAGSTTLLSWPPPALVLEHDLPKGQLGHWPAPRNRLSSHGRISVEVGSGDPVQPFPSQYPSLIHSLDPHGARATRWLGRIDHHRASLVSDLPFPPPSTFFIGLLGSNYPSLRTT